MNTESSAEPSRFHRIKKLTIAGGFMDGTNFVFDENLNCIIGPRGSGKSTALEFIRFAFDLEPAEFEDPHRRKKYESLMRANLSDGHVQVEVETRDGMCYTILRSLGEAPVIIDAEGEPTNFDLSAGALFRPEIFSQNDVERIADQPSFQLGLLDSFCFLKIEEISHSIGKIYISLKDNSNDILKTQKQIDVINEELKALPAVIERLKGFSQVRGANSDEVNKAHEQKSKRDREVATALNARNKILTEYHKLIAERESFVQEAQSAYPEDWGTGPDSPLYIEHREAFVKAVETVKTKLTEATNELSVTYFGMEALEEKIVTLNQKHDLAFQAIIQQFNVSTALSKERVELEKKRNLLDLRKREFVVQKENLTSLMNERQALLDKLSELRDERFTARYEVANKITSALSGNVMVRVIQNGDRGSYAKKLAELISSAQIRHIQVADRLAREIAPSDLADMVRGSDSESISRLSGISIEQAIKVVHVLSSKDNLMELDVVELDDLPKIELRDGDGYKDAFELSTGQKCTAILPILMLESENPLLIDQPEDNLDNRFVYSDIVGSIRSIKKSRQMVFVTHNPNIPVLGDAEAIFVLRSTGKLATIGNQGTVDQCKDDIVKLLEGGEEAFKMRKERYHF